MKSQIAVAIIACLLTTQIMTAFPNKVHFERVVENCEVYMTNKEEGCKTCKDGFFTKEKKDGSQTYNDCLACKSPCKNCKSETECTSCADGLFLNGKTCTKCPEGCKTCTSKTKCQKCHDGFRPDSGVCEKCKDANCKQCEKAPETCEVCNTSYFVKDKKSCGKCSDHCLECDNESKCTKCSDDYHLSDGSCSKYNWWRWVWIGALVCCVCIAIGAAVGLYLASKKKRGYKKQEDEYDSYIPEGSRYSDSRGQNYDFDPGYNPQGYDAYDGGRRAAPVRGGPAVYQPQADNFADYELQRGDFQDYGYQGGQQWARDQSYGYY